MTWRPDTIRSGARDDTPVCFGAVLYAARLSALLAGPGAYFSDDDLARDALLGRSLHRRVDAGFLRAGEYRVGDVSLPLGADRVFEGLFLRDSRGFLLACSVVPALFLFFRRYIRNRACESTKPSPRVLNALLAVLCAVIGVFFTFTLLHQFDLFTEI